jgi:hypothetical protein
MREYWCVNIRRQMEAERRREPTYSPELVNGLTTRDKMIALCYYVVESRYLEEFATDVDMYICAQSFGVYIGLLRYPSDYLDQATMNDMQLMSKVSEEERGLFIFLARTLPFARNYVAPPQCATQKRRRLTQKQAVQLAVVVMGCMGRLGFARLTKAKISLEWDKQRLEHGELTQRFINQHRFDLEEIGLESARAERRMRTSFIGFDTGPKSLMNMAYGIALYASFISRDMNRSELRDMVFIEYGMQPTFCEAMYVMGLSGEGFPRTGLSCRYCKIRAGAGLLEEQQQRFFCSQNCQREYHRLRVTEEEK